MPVWGEKNLVEELSRGVSRYSHRWGGEIKELDWRRAYPGTNAGGVEKLVEKQGKD